LESVTAHDDARYMRGWVGQTGKCDDYFARLIFGDGRARSRSGVGRLAVTRDLSSAVIVYVNHHVVAGSLVPDKRRGDRQSSIAHHQDQGIEEQQRKATPAQMHQ